MICLWASETDEATASGGRLVCAGERSNVPRDSAVLYGAGMMLNDTYL